LKLDEHVSLRGLYGFREGDYEFIKLEPQLYDFNLSEQLEEKVFKINDFILNIDFSGRPE